MSYALLRCNRLRIPDNIQTEFVSQCFVYALTLPPEKIRTFQTVLSCFFEELEELNWSPDF